MAAQKWLYMINANNTYLLISQGLECHAINHEQGRKQIIAILHRTRPDKAYHHIDSDSQGLTNKDLSLSSTQQILIIFFSFLFYVRY